MNTNKFFFIILIIRIKIISVFENQINRDLVPLGVCNSSSSNLKINLDEIRIDILLWYVI